MMTTAMNDEEAHLYICNIQLYNQSLHIFVQLCANTSFHGFSLDQGLVPFSFSRVWRGSSSPRTLMLGFTMLYNADIGHTRHSLWTIGKLYFYLFFLIQNSLKTQTNRIVIMGCNPLVENTFAMPTGGKMVEPFCVTRIALFPFNPPQTFPRNIDLKHSRQPSEHNEKPKACFYLSETPRCR